MNQAPLRSRLAPTPSGLLHPGNGLSFILTWSLTRLLDGQLLLRIDDLDRVRCRVDYIEDIFRTIDWLGLDYDEGPTGVADFLQSWSQHHRLDQYEAALQQLHNQAQLYACDCSRKTWQSISENELYPGLCRAKALPLEQPNTAWRIEVPAPCEVALLAYQSPPLSLAVDQLMGDFIVKQKDGLPAYQVASLVDDMAFGLNFIVRGEDLLPSTAAQLYLAQQLGWSAFSKATFFHHPLLLDEQGMKRSKRHGAAALAAWREAGVSPTQLYQQAAEWLGLVPQGVQSATDLLALLRASV